MLLVLVVVQAVLRMVHQDLEVVVHKAVQMVHAAEAELPEVKAVLTERVVMHQVAIHLVVVVEVVDIAVVITESLLTQMVVEVVEAAVVPILEILLTQQAGHHNQADHIITVTVELVATKAVALRVH